MTNAPKAAELRALAERVIGLTGPDRAVDALIWRATVPEAVHWGDNAAMLFTASLDAAMTLAGPRLAPDILRRASAALAEECALHIRFYDEAKDGPFTQRLARHITAAALLARAAQLEGAQDD